MVELLVAAGETIEVDGGLIVLESDKASLEVPTTVAGKVVELLVKEGDQLAEGDDVAVIEAAGDGGSDTAQRDTEKRDAGQADDGRRDSDKDAAETSGKNDAEMPDKAASAKKSEAEAADADRSRDTGVAASAGQTSATGAAARNQPPAQTARSHPQARAAVPTFMPARRCASWRANSVSRWKRSVAPDRVVACSRKICTPTPRRSCKGVRVRPRPLPRKAGYSAGSGGGFYGLWRGGHREAQ